MAITNEKLRNTLESLGNIGYILFAPEPIFAPEPH
jgi:hypothetical protein